MLFSFLNFLFLNSAMAASGPTNYGFLANKGILYINVYKDTETLGAGLAHDHAIQAVGWSGKATWDPAQPETCSLSLTVPVNNLQVDRPETRRLAGLEGDVSDSQRADITKNMLAEGQLNATAHPNISFQSTGCETQGDSITINGNFTLRGVSKSISVPVTVKSDNYSEGIQIKGSFKVKATDFGFEPYSALFGQIRNSNEMKINIDLHGVAKE